MFEAELEQGLDWKHIHEAAQAVSVFCSGPLWLVGGQAYRTIAKELYGCPIPANTDTDFVFYTQRTECKEVYGGFSRHPHLDGWHIKEHKGERWSEIDQYHRVSLVKNESYVDFWQAPRLNGNPSIQQYLESVPFTVQSIAYNMHTRKVEGDAGIQALLHRTVAINNEIHARCYAARKDTTVNQMIAAKARNLEFTPLIYDEENQDQLLLPF